MWGRAFDVFNCIKRHTRFYQRIWGLSIDRYMGNQANRQKVVINFQEKQKIVQEDIIIIRYSAQFQTLFIYTSLSP